MHSDTEMILCENLVKIYRTEETEILALQGLDLTVRQGDLVGIIGNSGSGKSTLLNMLGGLDKPTAGKILVNGQDLLKFKDRDLVEYRRSTVGFVWQNVARNLLPYLTATENIELVMRLKHRRLKAEHRRWGKELLDMVGLSGRADNKLSELSGGEQQRVAIGIALANQPKLLLADEPTGAVDTQTSDQILQVFREVNEQLGVTVVIVTHDMSLSRKVDRIIAIRDGKTSSEFIRRQKYSSALDEMGSFLDQDSHEEFVVMDRAGRVQLPREYLDSLGLQNKNKVRVELEDGKIIIEPVKETEEK
ncbi:Lipoprotein-releasing system ATP-binding protein LolD [uncultured Ruminococcus sp.]|uniref:ATP-binding cassette domain-containing protein n=1 Tax=Massiliimalia timonensis TaxID=1987501 RepID=UPI000822006B|nr:ATP-binding cassette domain-containing protein [Massiliimalia timonensis]SCH15118.1 Lipoprotein-releasing system ATP-binding protein LolD [uncultured Ruminococcus sp.]SCH81939.1 Lipoprotein-releasing system ATP-binding protein LolD [uncultured Clostridium sp.]